MKVFLNGTDRTDHLDRPFRASSIFLCDTQGVALGWNNSPLWGY